MVGYFCTRNPVVKNSRRGHIRYVARKSQNALTIVTCRQATLLSKPCHFVSFQMAIFDIKEMKPLISVLAISNIKF